MQNLISLGATGLYFKVGYFSGPVNFKTQIPILAFLYCGEFVKTSSEEIYPGFKMPTEMKFFVLAEFLCCIFQIKNDVLLK